MEATSRLRWTLMILVPAVSAAVFASAATLSISGTLGAGGAAVGRCATGGATTFQNVSSKKVVSVDVAGLAAGCGGGTVDVTVSNGVDPVGQGRATIPAGGGAVTVAIDPVVPLGEAHSLAVALQGP